MPSARALCSCSCQSISLIPLGRAPAPSPRPAFRSRDMAKPPVSPTARTRRGSLRQRREEPPARLRARLKQIITRLEQAYPDAICALQHRNPLELLVATILSAQSTDARVNMVTPALFTKYRTAQDYAAA